MNEIRITLREKRTELGRILQIEDVVLFNTNLMTETSYGDHNVIGDLNARLYLEIVSTNNHVFDANNPSLEYLMSIGKTVFYLGMELRKTIFKNIPIGDGIAPKVFILGEHD